MCLPVNGRSLFSLALPLLLLTSETGDGEGAKEDVGDELADELDGELRRLALRWPQRRLAASGLLSSRTLSLCCQR